MLCVCMSVCEPTAPSMSHFKVLSLPASWHLLTPTIIMLIYIVWLHKVIYAQFYSKAAQGCTCLLLNVLKRRFNDHQVPFIVSSCLNHVCFASIYFSHLSSYFINKIQNPDLNASAYWENNSYRQLSHAASFIRRRWVEITFLAVFFSSISEMVGICFVLKAEGKRWALFLIYSQLVE